MVEQRQQAPLPPHTVSKGATLSELQCIRTSYNGILPKGNIWQGSHLRIILIKMVRLGMRRLWESWPVLENPVGMTGFPLSVADVCGAAWFQRSGWGKGGLLINFWAVLSKS